MAHLLADTQYRRWLTFWQTLNTGDGSLYHSLLLLPQSHFIQVQQTLCDWQVPVLGHDVGDDEVVVLLLTLVWLLWCQHAIQKGEVNQGGQLGQSHLTPRLFNH